MICSCLSGGCKAIVEGEGDRFCWLEVVTGREEAIELFLSECVPPGPGGVAGCDVGCGCEVALAVVALGFWSRALPAERSAAAVGVVLLGAVDISHCRSCCSLAFSLARRRRLHSARSMGG